ncbi:MAG: hypothetical protein AABX65_02985, partial [Nanoarchaeota archaeon]
MEFIALLSDNQESWSQVSGLIKNGEWEKAVLVKDEFGGDFPSYPNVEIISISSTEKLVELKETLVKKLSSKFKGTEVALSIASGS